jgi:hypothetical protein
MIALAINSIVILSVVTIVSSSMLAGKSAENRQELATDFGLLQNYFAREIPNAGGMSLPADSAFWIENNCGPRGSYLGCAGSDRLSVATSDIGPVCTIQAWDPIGLMASFPFDKLNPCCLTATDILHKQVMFASGYDFRQLWVTDVDPVTCVAKFIKGPMATHDNTGAAYVWKSGLVIPISIDTFYLDTTNNYLKRFVYSTQGATPDEGTSLILADRVLDFQVMLGYDLNSDGTITDDGTATDEWLYNFGGSPIESPTTGVFFNMPKNILRMVGVGWVIGAPGAGKSGLTKASILDGPIRQKAGYVLQSGAAKFGVRSVYLFN